MKIETPEQANNLSRHQYFSMRFCMICRKSLTLKRLFKNAGNPHHTFPDYTTCRLPNENFITNFEICYKRDFVEQSVNFPTFICNGCHSSVSACARGKRNNPPEFQRFYSEDYEFKSKRSLTQHFECEELDEYPCSICEAGGADYVMSQPPAAKKVKTGPKARFCDQPYGPNNEFICQVRVGPGLNKHTCGVVANTHHIVKMAEIAGCQDQVVNEIHRKKEAILKKLKKAKRNEDLVITYKNLHGKASSYSRRRNTQRLENKNNKKLGITELINIQRTQFLPDIKMSQLISNVKKADGKVEDYTKYHQYLCDQLPDCHHVNYAWLPVKITKSQNDKEHLIKKYEVDMDLVHLHELKPNMSLRNVSFNEKTNKFEAERYCAIAYVSDFDQLMSQIKYHRKISDDDDILIKIQADGGGGTTKLACQIHTKKDLATKSYMANSLTTLLVLAETHADESSHVMKQMWELLQLESLCANYDVVWVSDLKLMNIMMGLTSGNAKFFCCKCDKDSNDCKPFECAQARNLSEWKIRVDNIPKIKEPKKNFSVERAPISWELVKNTHHIIPPELHICEGVINKTHGFLKDAGEIDLLSEWESDIHAKGYQGGKFTGNLCRQLLARRKVLEDKYPDIAFMLDIFYDLTHHLFSCGPITDDELDNFQDLIDLFKQAYEKTGISVTHKVHWLMFHVIDTMRFWKLKLGSLSEQDGESLHHFFELYKVYSSDKENYFTGPIEKWNRERLGPNPKIRTKSKSDDKEFDIEQAVNAYGIALL